MLKPAILCFFFHTPLFPLPIEADRYSFVAIQSLALNTASAKVSPTHMSSIEKP
jgi:hypothetical protein